MLRIFFLLFVSIFLYQLQASAQIYDTNSSLTHYSSNFTIWIPNKMISGQEYEGIIVLDKPTNQETIFSLSTNDKSTLDIPLAITIPPWENHGMFKIKAVKDGNATVFSALDGNLVQTSTTVYTSNSLPSSMKLIIPTTLTKAQSMQAYVFAEDKFGIPEHVTNDTEISVTSTSMISAPQTITIPKGQYYATLPLATRGSGTISISSDNLGIATANFTKIHDNVTVKLALAPDIVLPNSLAYYYIWLEKDGHPYKPPYTIHASLTSSNTNVSRFGNNYDIKHFSDILYSTTIRNGLAKGFVYTRNSGSTIISASVEGFGTASTNLTVGSSINNHATGKNTTSYCNPFSHCIPNMLKIWIYPTTFDESGYGIVGLYREINESNNTVIIPLGADSSTIQLSSNGSEVNYVKRIHMIPTIIPGSNEETGLSEAIEFPVESVGTGNFTLTVSGPGEMPDTINFNVRPKYDDSYNIKVVPLPIKAKVNQDLGMVYVVDNSGAMVEPSNIFIQPPKIEIQSTVQMPKNIDFTMTNMILTGTIEKNLMSLYQFQDCRHQ